MNKINPTQKKTIENSLQTDTENTKKTYARESFEKHLKLQGLETETENKSVSCTAINYQQRAIP